MRHLERHQARARAGKLGALVELAAGAAAERVVAVEVTLVLDWPLRACRVLLVGAHAGRDSHELAGELGPLLAERHAPAGCQQVAVLAVRALLEPLLGLRPQRHFLAQGPQLVAHRAAPGAQPAPLVLVELVACGAAGAATEANAAAGATAAAAAGAAGAAGATLAAAGLCEIHRALFGWLADLRLTD